MTERGRVRTAGYSLAYEVSGDGPPVILVHGLFGSRRWWARNTPQLSRLFRVYTVDLEGFGGNLTRRPFNLDRATGSLTHFMRVMEIDQASLVGHSMGGLVSLELANRVAAHVSKVVLVDAAVLAFDPNLPRRMAGLVHAIRWTPADLLPLLAADAVRAGPASFATAVHDLFATDHRAQLSRLTQPSLVVWGEHDTIVPMEIGVALTNALPNAHLAVIEDAGHAPMWEQAERFNRIVIDFLQEDGAPPDLAATTQQDPT